MLIDVEVKVFSGIDQSYTLVQTVLKILEKQKSTYLCFIDPKKANDSAWRIGLFSKMEQKGVSVKLVKLVRLYYQGVSVKVESFGFMNSCIVLCR